MDGEALHELAWRLPVPRGRILAFLPCLFCFIWKVVLKKLRTEIYLRLVQVRRQLLQVKLRIE